MALSSVGAFVGQELVGMGGAGSRTGRRPTGG